MGAIAIPRPGNTYGVHNNSLNNLRRGLLERVFATDAKGTQPLEPTAKFASRLANFARDLRSWEITPWSRQEFVESYHGKQRTRYQNALDSLLLTPLTARDARVATFVKAEKIDFSVKNDPAPRVIQPRDPRFNVEFGKFIRPLEHKMYKALSRLYKYPCVAKGFNAYETGDLMAKKWSRFKEPVGVGLDASRFDQHVSREALKWTHSIYKRFIKDPEFSQLCGMLLDNVGFATAKDGAIKYRIDRGRMSGDMDTALGNCVLMVAMCYSYCSSKGIVHELMDNGDDVVVIMEKDSLTTFSDGLVEWFAELGFKMKVEEPVTRLEALEFCQTKPVFDGTQWRMVRGIPALSKDLVCVKGPDELLPWLYAVGECGLALTDGIPVFAELYHYLKRCGSPTRVAHQTGFTGMGMYNLARRMHYVGKPVTDTARRSFFDAFGITPDMQIDLENLYRSLGTPTGKIERVIDDVCNWRHPLAPAYAGLC
nr:MAG: RNA-dependent RNA polymerase [Guiyang Paspalum paspaloides tombus-like virus 1]